MYPFYFWWRSSLPTFFQMFQFLLLQTMVWWVFMPMCGCLGSIPGSGNAGSSEWMDILHPSPPSLFSLFAHSLLSRVLPQTGVLLEPRIRSGNVPTARETARQNHAVHMCVPTLSPAVCSCQCESGLLAGLQELRESTCWTEPWRLDLSLQGPHQLCFGAQPKTDRCPNIIFSFNYLTSFPPTTKVTRYYSWHNILESLEKYFLH